MPLQPKSLSQSKDVYQNKDLPFQLAVKKNINQLIETQNKRIATKSHPFSNLNGLQITDYSPQSEGQNENYPLNSDENIQRQNQYFTLSKNSNANHPDTHDIANIQ